MCFNIVSVGVEFSELVYIIPNFLTARMKDMRAVDMNINVFYLLSISISAYMISFIYDKDFASRIEEIKPKLAIKAFLEVQNIEAYQLTSRWDYPTMGYDDQKMIIF